MAAVRVLPEELVNQIAAGEVVERPASVVKELVENALDAGARRVEVAIEEGGLRRIAVIDDGSGMSRADAELAFSRHATSKIASAEDLAGVRTLGFRGEALPAIASVARVRMRTRRAADPLGVELVGEGHGIERVREVASPAGTQIEVAELFGLVPARRKFLKSPITEATHALRWLERIALVRPDVRFSLERDGRASLLYLPTADARERAIAVLPPALGERLVEFSADAGRVRASGWATPTDVARGTAADIHAYVNARPVRDRLLMHAVREAYRDALPPGRHPAVVLLLDVAPDEVDVNVHPAKWEVRFREPQAIVRLVRDAIGRAVGAPRRLYPVSGAGPTGGGAGVAEGRPFAPGGFEGAGRAGEGELPSLLGDWRLAPEIGRAAGAAPTGRIGSFRSLRYLGQALGTFLVLEAAQGIVLIDQHAAHERVLFERMREALLGGKPERQALLLPEWLELAPSAAGVLVAHAAELERIGFDLLVADRTERGGVRVALREVPAELATRAGVDWPALLAETAEALVDPTACESRDGIERAVHAGLATAACHAAVRKGDRLDARAVEGLLEALDQGVWFPNCPHGRPILAVLERAEIERRFLR
jgi:DNA mismatch repair protein MutL